MRDGAEVSTGVFFWKSCKNDVRSFPEPFGCLRNRAAILKMTYIRSAILKNDTCAVGAEVSTGVFFWKSCILHTHLESRDNHVIVA